MGDAVPPLGLKGGEAPLDQKGRCHFIMSFYIGDIWNIDMMYNQNRYSDQSPIDGNTFDRDPF
jgi:hypothetical protein